MTSLPGGAAQAMARLFRARLSRQAARWIFLTFLVVEGIVLVPSVLRQAERLGEQLRQVTNGKLEWIVDANPSASSSQLLAAVRRLHAQQMVQSIRGASLYRASSGQLLGRFGESPRLSFADVRQHGTRQRWFPRAGSLDASWGPESLRGDHLLVVRHDAATIREGLARYIRNIALIVLGIAGFLTLITMLVMDRLVIGRVLALRDRLLAAGSAFTQEGGSVLPEQYLLPVSRADELGQVEEAFNQSFLRTSEEMERRLEAERVARAERLRAEALLLNILPAPIAEEMKRGRQTISEVHGEVSVLFADIVGFTELTRLLACDDLVILLNELFTEFDLLSERHGLEKIKTIGDNYMVVGGLPRPDHLHAEAIADMALDMQAVIRSFAREEVGPLSLRIGIHAGPVVAGVIGRRKFSYDLWGETVNIASRMESHSLPGRIQVSQASYERLRHAYRMEPRGRMPIKGIGEITTYWLGERRLPRERVPGIRPDPSPEHGPDSIAVS